MVGTGEVVDSLVGSEFPDEVVVEVSVKPVDVDLLFGL